MAADPAQEVLARLYTDAALRAQFLADPALFAKQQQLSDETTNMLMTLPRDQLEQFARGLIQKRLGQVRQCLPASRLALGNLFDERFRRWAASHSAVGINKLCTDALRFVEELCEGPCPPFVEPWHRDLLRWEVAEMEMRQTRRAFRLLLMRYSPETLLAASASGTPPSKRPAFKVWFRLVGWFGCFGGGELHDFTIPLWPRISARGGH